MGTALLPLLQVKETYLDSPIRSSFQTIRYSVQEVFQVFSTLERFHLMCKGLLKVLSSWSSLSENETRQKINKNECMCAPRVELRGGVEKEKKIRKPTPSTVNEPGWSTVPS